MTSVLETQQDVALHSFFRAVDSAEEAAEGRRRRLTSFPWRCKARLRR